MVYNLCEMLNTRIIPVYKAEMLIDGLAEKVQSMSSIAYVAPLEKWTPDENAIARILPIIEQRMAKSSVHDSDLYYTKSILVSTNWNKNDDVFDVAEVWAAKNTPLHKPTNIDHDEKQLVGHMVDNWAIDNDGTVIPDNISIDDLPSLYHIVNGAVVYKNWQSVDLNKRTQGLIDSIEAGDKFVSMECLFSNFDFAIQTTDGQSRIVSRNEETAFLTKYLRVYGGVGIYDGNKVGRLLRNITFSGKAYVDKPANPNSIILNNATIFDFAQAHKVADMSNNGVLIPYSNNQAVADTKENNMSEDILKEQNKKLQTKIEDLEKQLSEATTKLAKADVEQYELKITELQKQIENSMKNNDELKKTNAELTEKVSTLESQTQEMEKTKGELENQIKEVKAAELRANRVAKLVDGGISKDIAEIKVQLFGNLNDEQFEDYAKEIIDALKIKSTITDSSDSEQTDTDVEESDSAASDVDDTTLDNADTNTNDLDMTVGNESNDEMVELRKQLSKAIASRIGIDVDEDLESDEEGE